MSLYHCQGTTREQLTVEVKGVASNSIIVCHLMPEWDYCTWQQKIWA